MLLRIFTLGFDPIIGYFDDSAVRDFLSDKEVLSITDHFFERDGLPYLVLVVRYRLMVQAPVPPPQAKTPKAARRGRDESWRELLDQSDWPLFNSLRDWRSERAKAAGIPPYVICNNRELATLVHRRPTTLAQIAEIEGFGDAKLKNYGADLLGFVARAGQDPETPDGAS
jgi:superfamily II DNA helicase RecQ